MNICSIQKHFDELCIVLDSMEFKFEVIILTEAWLGLDNTSSNNLQMNDYTIHSSYHNKNKNYGIVIYLKNTLKEIFVSELNTQNLNSLEISFKFFKTAFLIYPIYRSPNSDIETI